MLDIQYPTGGVWWRDISIIWDWLGESKDVSYICKVETGDAPDQGWPEHGYPPCMYKNCTYCTVRITFWSRFLGDDDSSILVCISLNSL
jgi:hypothetical protein